MWPSSLDIDVSRESLEKLETYHALLVKWQKAINLVSPKTIPEAWGRHFADSAQIERYVSRESIHGKALKIVDIGSGAGFAGLVLAIMRPDIDVHLVESDERKCQFMRTVSRETQTPVTVDISRIEAVQLDFVPNIVTARALADLTLLFDYIYKWVEENPNLEAIFLKGMKIEEELTAARRKYDFSVEIHPSLTDPSGCIAHFKNIQKK
ncbi:MAG: 16S rRNA (guanine(527)-N(7))-methyltransferase RsmG [Micavibrio sp.]|nr:16S rRNA (guanine(527)-N(7))-methyltransferase RsmG [Micavibrio sp.]